MQDQKSKIKLIENNQLPPIPDKLYFAIGEVSELCQLKPHVLRYWEQEFPQLSPSKRRGNRRYYKHKDVLLIRQIRSLLYEQGYTIEGARTQLTAGIELKADEQTPVADNVLAQIAAELQKVLETLKTHHSSVPVQASMAELIEETTV